MITPKVEAQGIREAIIELKGLDKELLKILRADLRNKLGPFAKQIAAAVPTEPILSRFVGERSYGWSPVKPTVAFTPGKSRNGNHLVSIRITPSGGARGLYVAELAGSRSGGKNARGAALIRNLNAKHAMKKHGGRFAYQQFRLLRPDAMQIAINIVNESLSAINKRLEI